MQPQSETETKSQPPAPADQDGDLEFLRDTAACDAEKQLQFISSLPKLDGWTVPHRLYQNFWIPEDVLPGVLAVQESFRPRPTDIIVASLPKSGTTWLKAVTFAIAYRATHSLNDEQHPVLKRNSHHLVLSVEYLHAMNLRPHDLDQRPSPRVVATHIPYSLLPAAARDDSPCRFIYVCREPKDALISLWHYMKKMKPEVAEVNEAFELFAKGGSQFGPAWEHNLEYWNESQKRPEKVLFLRYEDMMAEPAADVRRIATFMGLPFTAEEEAAGAPEKVAEICSFDKMRNTEVNKNGVGRIGDVSVHASIFFREGKVGDWANYLTPEMAERLDRIVSEKLDGSGLTYGARSDNK